jgi:hypothetical protein
VQDVENGEVNMSDDVIYDMFDPAPIETQDWREIDRKLGLPNDEQLRKLAEAIDANHKGQSDATASWRTSSNRLTGLRGERAFARVFEVPMDVQVRRYGNYRRNFALRHGPVVDVVTRTWCGICIGAFFPELTVRHNPRPTGKVLCLVYDQGDYLEPLIKGWILDHDAERIGRVGSFRSGIENRIVSPAMLRDPLELLRLHNPNSKWVQWADLVRSVESEDGGPVLPAAIPGDGLAQERFL